MDHCRRCDLCAMGVLVSDLRTALVGIDVGDDAWAETSGNVCNMGRREVPLHAGEGASSCVGECHDVRGVLGERGMDDMKLDV